MEGKEFDIGESLLVQNYNILKPKILVFGIGGAGTNAVNNMINSDLVGVEFIVANTDGQSLISSPAKNKIQLGPKTTKGLGAGMMPEVGKESAEEVMDEIAKYLDTANMIFITAGMGGGTGTGAAPVIAKMARERDILTAAVVTKPFFHEGSQRMLLAEKGIEELKKYVDTLIIIPNQNLYKVANEETTFQESFQMVDHVLKLGIKGITDLITQPGLVNLDFADIKTVMKKMGKSMMGMGEAKGENRAIRAVEEAISNPLLDNSSIKGAKGIVVNITASPDFTLYEYEAATKKIKEEADDTATIIIGNALDEEMDGSVRISVFATGIEDLSMATLEETYNQMKNNANEEDSTEEDLYLETTSEEHSEEYISKDAEVEESKTPVKKPFYNLNNFNDSNYNQKNSFEYEKNLKANAIAQYIKNREKEQKMHKANDEGSIKKFFGMFTHTRKNNGQVNNSGIRIKADDDLDIDIYTKIK